MNAKGGAPERIATPDHRSMAYPTFSHDGRWIYFIPGSHERPVEAWKAPSKGGEAVQVTRRGAFQPEESPDSKLLYYRK
jgi:Tol biopolymer transport system component